MVVFWFLGAASRGHNQPGEGKLINYLHTEWFEKTLKIIADASNRSLDEVKNAHRTEAYFGDSLHYVQLGNPEEIVIVPQSGAY